MSTQRHGLFKYRKENVEVMSSLFENAIQVAELELGSALGKADCFFDSIAQALNEKSGKEEYNVKSLRLLCDEYIKSNSENNAWVRKAVEAEEEDYPQYLARLQYTVEEMEVMEKENILAGTATWGRASIEGRIICEKLKVKLHVIEGREPEPGVHDTLLIHQIVSAEKSKQIDEKDINYLDKDTVHIAVANLHFVPILKKAKSEAFANTDNLNLQRLDNYAQLYRRSPGKN